jgi:hypothetical protein
MSKKKRPLVENDGTRKSWRRARRAENPDKVREKPDFLEEELDRDTPIWWEHSYGEEIESGEEAVQIRLAPRAGSGSRTFTTPGPFKPLKGTSDSARPRMPV